jgi:hypothetical protein
MAACRRQRTPSGSAIPAARGDAAVLAPRARTEPALSERRASSRRPCTRGCALFSARAQELVACSLPLFSLLSAPLLKLREKECGVHGE